MRKRYPSNINYSLFLFMNLIAIGPILPAVIMNKNSYFTIVGLLFILVVLLLNWSMLFKTCYCIDNETLYIKSGFFYSKTIPIENIRKIEETKNVFNAPALATKRLAITFNSCDTVFVSPKDKTDFVMELLTLNPNIQQTN